jgi:glycosyltransferase involved in cell wall biosynthesis
MISSTAPDVRRPAGPPAPLRRLKIAYVVHDYNRRFGHSRYVAELTSRFKRDHEVHLFANTFEEPDPEGIVYHHVPAWRMNVMTTLLSFILPGTWMLRGLFDVVHAQGFCALRRNVATAHMCQDAWLEAMARNAGPPAWRKRLFHSVAGWLERRTFAPGGARRFIAVSRRVEADLRRYYGCAEGVRVIYHGVDAGTFHPRNKAIWRPAVRRQIGLPEEALLALYVGDFQKGLAPTVRAVARVPGLHLAAVSRSPTEPYRALIRDEGVADRVRLLPATPHVERFYAAADLFVFPTFYDPFGLVATEAMASGLPVVCSGAAGAAELIEDGVDGLIVKDSWDVAALADALGRLASDPALRRRLGEAARRRVETQTWDETARQTMAVYREICLG